MARCQNHERRKFTHRAPSAKALWYKPRMKLTLLLLSLVAGLGAVAQDKVVVPSRVVTPFVRVFDAVELGAAEALLSTSELRRTGGDRDESKNWDFVVGTGTLKLPRARFERIEELAGAVVEARVGDNAFGYGTAFHVGDGVFLTNQHVLSSSRENTTECGGFRVTSPRTRASYRCEKVLVCNKAADYCLIRMRAGGFLGRGPDPALLPTLPLRRQRTPDLDGTYSVLGNPGGFGIHFSEGTGVARHFTNFITFYAPVHNGNSGGPLLNAAGEVIGVVHAQSAYGAREGAYNLAVALDFIERDVREQLGAAHPDAAYFSSLVLEE